MAFYIDVDAIEYHEIYDGQEFVRVAYGDDIDNAPTADVVEVVRCKDCKWQDKGENECESWNLCRHNVIEHFAIYDEHFCGWGERREDGE